MQILPDVHRLQFRHRDRWLYVYLLVGDRVLLVDTGTAAVPEAVILPALRSLGLEGVPRPLLALDTHADADHAGGNAAIRAAIPQALILCHERDRAHIEDHQRLWEERYTGALTPHGLGFAPELADKMRASMGQAVPVDLVLTGGESIRLRSDWEIEILFTPGHTLGHVTVYDPRNQAAYIADAVLGLGVPTAEGDRLAIPPNYDDVDAYAATARLLGELPLDVLCTSHFPLLRGEAIPPFLAETEAWVSQTDAAVLAVLHEAKGPVGMRALIAAVNPQLGNWPEGPATTLAVSLATHLARLEKRGQVVRVEAGGLPAWRLRD